MDNKKEIEVMGEKINFFSRNYEEYICLTDIARVKQKYKPDQVIQNWFRNRHTIEYLGIWEKMRNKNFNPLEFEGLLFQSGSNSFLLSPSKWIEKTNSIGIIVKKGKYGGTYAHKYIALAFASWISAEFELYLISEFDRLKEEEKNIKKIEWNLKRTLTKINYKIHTDAIKNNLIPNKVTNKQSNLIYSNEADLLNVALFGITAKDWRYQNKNKEGNLRDYAEIPQLICLSNLESFNSEFIKEGLNQQERLIKLNKIAISQMKLLIKDNTFKKLN